MDRVVDGKRVRERQIGVVDKALGLGGVEVGRGRERKET